MVRPFFSSLEGIVCIVVRRKLVSVDVSYCLLRWLLECVSVLECWRQRYLRSENTVIPSIISGQFVAFNIELGWERPIFFCYVIICMFECRFDVVRLVARTNHSRNTWGNKDGGCTIDVADTTSIRDFIPIWSAFQFRWIPPSQCKILWTGL